ncbi:MAG: Type 1 glutamine amidotransferase-like domain-containing protein [Chloroflexota bacterium]
MDKEIRIAGPVALVGSGEFLHVMDDTDLAISNCLGGPAATRVAVIPTASGLEEPESPARWARLGLEHFGRLGAQVDAVPILNRPDAEDPRMLAILEAANFYYFSGGNPLHLIDTMRDTPAWSIIARRHAEGAALAGCSAGAMAICGQTSRFRGMREDDRPAWAPALGVLPRLIVVPHYDRIASFIGDEAAERLVRNVPDGAVLLGIEEDTALVRLESNVWRVMGQRRVWVFSAGERAAYEAGRTVSLDGDPVQMPLSS